MSSLQVPVATIDKLLPHSNADALELAHVLGWQLVVQKGRYQEGDKIVYFPIDTVLPQELSDRLEVTKYLDKQRIRCTKLRGEPSFGLAITPDDPAWGIGENVAEYYGATKYEPPQRGFTRHGVNVPHPDALPEHPLFYRYTDIENMRNFPDIFDDGEPVLLTEKIHGCNSRIGIIEGEWMAGSRKIRRKPVETGKEQESIYWYPMTLEPVHLMLTKFSEHYRQVVLYGEIYGPSIQSLHYGMGQGTLGFRAFDLLIDGKFCNWHTFHLMCASYGVETVPLIDEAPFSLDMVKAHASGNTLLVDDTPHIREGVVVKPLAERSHPKIGRCILKYVSDAYLFAKKTDFAEE